MPWTICDGQTTFWAKSIKGKTELDTGSQQDGLAGKWTDQKNVVLEI